jgi:phage virion morphogenesis protein
MNLEGSEELIAKLKRITNKKVLAKVMKYIAGKMESHTRRGFAKQIDPSGNKWVKRKDKRAQKILTKTGALAGGVRSAYTETSAQWGVSSATPYGIYHQFGTRKMPQRKIVATQISEIPEKIDEKIAKALEQA